MPEQLRHSFSVFVCRRDEMPHALLRVGWHECVQILRAHVAVIKPAHLVTLLTPANVSLKLLLMSGLPMPNR